MAQGILRRLLEEARIDASVDSAGLHPGGAPATPTAVQVLADAGIDITGHRSRNLADVNLGGADLVIGMERRHLQEAVLLEPSVMGRAFTLPELVRRSSAAPARIPGTLLRDWATRLSADRTTADLLGTAEGVDDPIGMSRARYEETAQLLFALLQSFVHRAWPHVAANAR